MFPPFIKSNKLLLFRDEENEEQEAEEDEDEDEEDDELQYKDFWHSKIRLILSFWAPLSMKGEASSSFSSVISDIDIAKKNFVIRLKYMSCSNCSPFYEYLAEQQRKR